MAAKEYANTRFSALDEIHTGNIKSLQLAWSFSTGGVHGHEATPLVVNNTMYVVTPFAHVLFAIDPLTGTKKWEYHPKPVNATRGFACCDLVNRGPTFSNGRRYYATLNNQVVAVDAVSGKES